MPQSGGALAGGDSCGADVRRARSFPRQLSLSPMRLAMAQTPARKFRNDSRKGGAAERSEMPAAPVVQLKLWPVLRGRSGQLQDGCTISRADDAATKLAY
jgi:hypothetical protein